MKNIVSWSGGKDSTAMLLRMIELGYQIDDIIFIDIKFNDSLGGELPEMYDYIKKIEEYIGRKVTKISSNKTYLDCFYRVKEKGKYIGEIYGFPSAINSWCNSELKRRALIEYYKTIKDDYTVYVGISANETKRLQRLKGTNKVSPLADWNWTGKDCLNYLESKGLKNPLYENKKRTGCWFCPKQDLNSLRILRNNYPELWNELLKIDKDSKTEFLQSRYTVHDLEKRFKNEK